MDGISSILSKLEEIFPSFKQEQQKGLLLLITMALHGCEVKLGGEIKSYVPITEAKEAQPLLQAFLEKVT